MKTRTLITLLACYALNAHALPIVFSGTQFETSTAAIAGAQADAEFDSSPPSTLPLVTSATVVGASDFASGNAIAASGLLATSAEASSVAGLASGTLRPIIGREMPLAQAPQAHEAVLAPGSYGKIVLLP